MNSETKVLLSLTTAACAATLIFFIVYMYVLSSRSGKITGTSPDNAPHLEGRTAGGLVVAMIASIAFAHVLEMATCDGVTIGKTGMYLEIGYTLAAMFGLLAAIILAGGNAPTTVILAVVVTSAFAMAAQMSLNTFISNNMTWNTKSAVLLGIAVACFTGIFAAVIAAWAGTPYGFEDADDRRPQIRWWMILVVLITLAVVAAGMFFPFIVSNVAIRRVIPAGAFILVAVAFTSALLA